MDWLKIYPSSLFQRQGSSNYKLPATRKNHGSSRRLIRSTLLLGSHIVNLRQNLLTSPICEAADFLAKQFCAYEQLSAALDLKPELMGPYFKELLEHVKNMKSAFSERQKLTVSGCFSVRRPQ